MTEQEREELRETNEMKMKTTKTTVTKISIELDEQEAMILAKIIDNVGGNHEWRSFTDQLCDELLDHLGVDNIFEFAPDAIKEPMTIGE